MLLWGGRRAFNYNLRTKLRRFTSGNNHSYNFRKGFDDRSLGILALLVSVPAVRLCLFMEEIIISCHVGSFHLEASQIN